MQAVASVSKAEFARMCGVSPGRVSQWLSAKKLTGSAIDGEGRDAKIRPDVAKVQLRRTLDLRQRVANGLGTRLEIVPTAPPAEEAPEEEGDGAPQLQKPGEFFDQAERELTELRLSSARRKERLDAEAEAAKAGRYVDAEDVVQQMGRLATRLVSEFEGSLPDLATAIAAQFKLEQRDVLHTLRQSFRLAREKAADKLEQAAEAAPALIDDEKAEEELAAAE